ncbi:MAG: PilZ domain-containing protein [Deltaproteobacteria bacterium]
MEHRNFTRVSYCECASVKHDDQAFFGDIENVSLQGLFIKTPQKVPINTPVEITVYFSQSSSMYLNANVVRCEDTGLGIQISKMDVNSFVHLRNAVSMHCNDQDILMRETFKVTSCIH